MLDFILQIIAPHHCYSCGKSGRTLCDNCKYDIVSEPFCGCIVCRRPTTDAGICYDCPTTYERAWVVAERTDSIEQLLDNYKFSHQKANALVFADLLNEVLPDFSQQSPVVTAIPTITPHIRMRGYDHVALVAKKLATARGLTYQQLLTRQNTTKQIGSSRQQRFENAKRAFTCVAKLPKDQPILLIDDVFTTGATLQYGAQALQKAGAERIWIAVIARQPLDKEAK